MIYKATKLIAAAFEQEGLSYEILEWDDASIVAGRFSIRNGPETEVDFISADDSNIVHAYLMPFVNKIDVKDRMNVMCTLNMINRESLYVKFYLGDHGNVRSDYTISGETSDESIGMVCIDLLCRYDIACNEAYRSIMRVIKSDDKE